jgi:hypothetical protein
VLQDAEIPLIFQATICRHAAAESSQLQVVHSSQARGEIAGLPYRQSARSPGMPRRQAARV